MLVLKDSDFFNNYIDRNSTVMGRANAIVRDPNTVILNQILFDEIKRKIIDNRKETSVYAMGKAIASGKLVLTMPQPTNKLPGMVPFLSYKSNGQPRMLVNMYDVVIPVKNPDDSTTYELADANKAYSILYGAWLALEKLYPNAGVSSNTIYYAAILWADMFTKPLYDTIGMNNQDRNIAFMYFAMKFFMKYIMQCKSDEMVDSMVKRYIPTKNDYILTMEENMNDLGEDPYTGFVKFIEVLFNDQITQIKGIRVNTLDHQINMTYYVQRFISTFDQNAILALCTFPYFMYVIIASVGRTGMLKDKAFDRIFAMHKTELHKLLIEIQKD